MASLPKEIEQNAKLISRWNWIALWLPIFGLFPLLLLEIEGLWSKPHLQFFPLSLGVVAWVCYGETMAEKKLVGGVRLILAVVALCMYLVQSLLATFFYSPWLAHLAIIITFSGWALVRFSNANWTRVVAICALFGSTLPLPLNWDRKLIGQLQTWSAQACGLALDGLNIPNFLQGNVIQIEKHTLFVEEACSGVTSLYSLIALGLIYSVIQRRSLIPSLALLLITPLVAINGNILRLLAISLGFEWWSIDLSHGFLHDVVGISTFIASGLALICMASILDLILAPIPKLRSDKSIFRRTFNVLAGWPNYTSDFEEHDELSNERGVDSTRTERQGKHVGKLLGSFSLLLLVGFLSSLTFLPLAVVFARSFDLNKSAISPSVDERFAKMFPVADSLPVDLGNGWKRRGYNESTRQLSSQIGQYSHTWRYVKADRAFIVSIDFAFRGWHGLEVCYRNNGWTINDIRTAEKELNPWSWVECNMSNELGIKGYLWYSLFDEYGRDYEMEVDGLGLDIRFARQSILDAFRAKDKKEVPLTFQVQVFSETGPAMTEDEFEEMRHLFLEIREQVRGLSMPAINSMKER